MGSDYALNPPKPVWEWMTYPNEEDALLAISIAWEIGWQIKAYHNAEGYRIGIHKGEYI